MALPTVDEYFIGRYQTRFSLEIDSDMSFRQRRLFILYKFLDNSIYDNLLPFSQEYEGGGNGKYISLVKRRPSIIYALPEIIVDETIGMLFGEEHFPFVKCPHGHDETIEFLNILTKDTGLKSAMLEAAYEGSIGSVCIVVKLVNSRFCYEVLNTMTLMPYFDSQNPGSLIRLTDRRKTDGSSLKSCGYSINEEELNKSFILIREWNTTQEIYYKPFLEEDQKKENFSPVPDPERTVTHDLGFLPAVWIKNLPRAKDIDGRCTFAAAIDTSIEINYQLSQHGRLLRYNSDPTMVVKNPSDLTDGQLVKSVNALTLDTDGDAYLLEMKGNITSAVMEFVEKLRKYGLESVRGNRSDPEKMHAAQSGKALQFLNHPLVILVGNMRLTYGDNGLLKIYQIILKICKSNKFDIKNYAKMPVLNDDCENHLTLDWPDWYPPTAQDDFNEAQTTNIYVAADVISKKTALENIADKYNVIEIDKELQAIQEESKKSQELAQQAQGVLNTKPAPKNKQPQE